MNRLTQRPLQWQFSLTTSLSICTFFFFFAFSPAPLFETECSYLEATLAEFLCWTSGSDAASVGPFADYPLSEYWAYADYKYIALLFQEKTSMFKVHQHTMSSILHLKSNILTFYFKTGFIQTCTYVHVFSVELMPLLKYEPLF